MVMPDRIFLKATSSASQDASESIGTSGFAVLRNAVVQERRDSIGR
jgi:hypothetical protein